MVDRITGVEKLAQPARVILLGGILLDRYLEVDHYPTVGQDTLIRRSFDTVGGCCLNVAVTLKNLGSLPYIVTQWGDDEIGSEIEQHVASLALPTTCMRKVAGTETGYCLVVLDQAGERTFFTYKGCEAEFSLEDFPAELTTDVAFAYVTGYYLLNPQTTAAVIELIRQLREKGCQILFDPGPLVGEMEAFQLRELLRCSDWLVPNLAELALIKTKLELGEDLERWVLGQGCKGLVVKKGSAGVEVVTPAGKFVESALRVTSKDTTGAGDSFTGGFIHGLANGYSLGQAVILANACGAYATTIKGPHGVFSLADINHLIASFKDNNS